MLLDYGNDPKPASASYDLIYPYDAMDTGPEQVYYLVIARTLPEEARRSPCYLEENFAFFHASASYKIARKANLEHPNLSPPRVRSRDSYRWAVD